ncbi:alpha/beta hydrolase-fold protein [Marinoscillum furvescens]|uniref:Putative secreted protein (Por secretion system target) n=1 Tax=Marinoscillum furvescens DSM 4134 TaxID=1122208 RepID=A0A3D9KYB4_MARFU|nr:alpha/beta hydrolase-fold protein [Marinoscillum furvescens]RED93392.1 putative secreted protein (Por secretion system target) [Marinoscillum furvescens DSM 4134]
MTRILLSIPLLFWGLMANSQTTIVIADLPENHPQNAPIYLAGTLNDWNPASEAHQLQKDDAGNYYITLNLEGEVAFKFTRGDWNTVESDGYGNDIGNRTYQPSGEDTLKLYIQGWKDLLDGSSSPNSTRSENVSILKDFEIPQLGRKRNIWIYLPPNYHQTKTSYPVIYMHDGQNLFDNSTSFSGEWNVDETLNDLFETQNFAAIVVGIDNGGEHRMDEYAPWINTQYGGGEGEAYVDFLVSTLKPHIDAHYRTLTSASNTAIIGSSLGGIISFYAGLKYSNIFGKIGALSPAFWYNPEFFGFTDSITPKGPQKLYMAAGGDESATVANNMNRIAATLQTNGWPPSAITKRVHPHQGHNEAYWSAIFKEVISYLMMDSQPLQVTKHFNFKITDRKLTTSAAHIRIFGLTGQKLLQDSTATTAPVDLSKLPEGIYLLQLRDKHHVATVRILLR